MIERVQPTGSDVRIGPQIRGGIEAGIGVQPLRCTDTQVVRRHTAGMVGCGRGLGQVKLGIDVRADGRKLATLLQIGAKLSDGLHGKPPSADQQSRRSSGAARSQAEGWRRE
ncbi:hypothetical protein CYR75_14455 [Paracoccus jeotgali]|uniref:Uncharacterized protein n=1 Tax=Paracoccus jeotgali TaxID=2065379 RepID=A0A2K9MI95_9RHOB|nr:hypothetical protein CYR75_14455 [Paracoccus jeotgali]